jgi:2-methylcitrate dehydratase PrpD
MGYRIRLLDRDASVRCVDLGAGRCRVSENDVGNPCRRRSYPKAFDVHPDAEAAGFDKMTTIIEVEIDDGTVMKGSADSGKGSPENPMSDAELADKFRQCAAWGGLDREQTQTVLDLAWRIETIEDIGELTRHLRKVM